MKKAIIALEDGTCFQGRAFAGSGEFYGELVFNTSMTGYQEILTDPSYYGQIVTMTYPLIGNYGINTEDEESRGIFAAGLVVGECSRIYSNWRAEKSLQEYLEENGKIGVDQVDTRAITLHIREKGAMKCVISTEDLDKASLIQKAKNSPGLVGRDLASEVSIHEKYVWPEGGKPDADYKVAVIDCGIKLNQLRIFDQLGCECTVYPANTPAAEILSTQPDGIFISNGPGDPSEAKAITQLVCELIDSKLPMFGICFGHQLLGRALGADTFKLKFGHRGANQPIQDLRTTKIEIASHNHGFCIDVDSINPEVIEVTHVNLNDNTVAGLKHKKQPLFCVQYHPEAAPGPHDPFYLFEEFLDLMRKKETSTMSRKIEGINKVLIIGSGPIVIGQACEFDYSGTQACKALRELGYEIVLVNSNPATIMTDPGTADATYIEPLNLKTIEKIIEKEKPDALLPNLGGQTALNLASEMAKAGILEKHGVKVIGVELDAIERGEDRMAFKKTMEKLGIEMARSTIINSMEEAEEGVKDIGFPCVIRPAYTMGGTGGGLVYNMDEFRTVIARGLTASMVHQCLIEESVLGWEELELEVVRDRTGRMITVCFIENIDPMGVHTGDSCCTAPMLTISEELQNRLQKYAYDIVESIGVIGGTNVQFAHDPQSGRVIIIEINPRTSRSSALASKATGFPIALVSAKLAGGLTLGDIPYWRNGTLDKYTPSGDYVVVKFARWAFEKFKGIEDKLGTQMRAVGEVMSIGKNYKEALQKAIRSLEQDRYGLGFAKDFNNWDKEKLLAAIATATSERQFQIYEALRKGATIDEVHRKTNIKRWFLEQMKELVELEERIIACKGKVLSDELLIEAKKDGFADRYIAQLLGIPEKQIRAQRLGAGLAEAWEAVPVSGVEDRAYYYSTYNAPDKTTATKNKKVMVLGGGPNRIGQGIEFDYCCVHAALTLRDEGYETIMVNCNPETVSTDYDTSDKLYFEPLTVEDVLSIYEKEKPEGVICQFGGQTPLNIAAELEDAGVKVLGTTPAIIDLAEDRDQFRGIMEKLGIPMPEAGFAVNAEEALAIARRIGYPLMVRPSYVLGGRGMEVVYDDDMLYEYMKAAIGVTPDRPILIDRFLQNALECEADAIADGTDAFVPAVMEHIELAGIHSGDSACVIPPVSIPEKHVATIRDYTARIAKEMKVVGLMNIQYAICDDVVYVLEANPRASRTVPIVSKVCGLSMARAATKILLGKKLSDLDLQPVDVPYYGVKESIFPFNMFPEVDPVLGPEMRSTGEVLGLASTPAMAFYKAQEATKSILPTEGAVLISVNDACKEEALDIAKTLTGYGFKIYATDKTQTFFVEQGVEAKKILKQHEGRPNIADAIANGEIQLVINTPVGKQSIYDDSYIRKSAIRHGIPYVTTMAAAKATTRGIADRIKNDTTIKSLQSYHADIKKA